MEKGRVELWQRAMAVFVEALERDGSSRRELVAERCGEDEELRQAVDTLLRADGDTGGELPDLRHALVTAPEAQWRGVVLGNHRIVSRLGAGGMGVVFLAERADGAFEQRAAIKVLRPGTLTPAARERFEQERSILARLEHPAIARLIDGGETESGEPFLTMEYVDGEPIDVYCGEHELSIDDRLRLFQRVCAGVEYAHRNLTVHRDLKPSNILVAADGAPRIVDFGIAKLLDPAAGGATVTVAHTPDYASPEQLLGLPLTTATDVFSLGVVLYELVSGRRPERPAAAGPRETLEAPLRPPSAVSTLSGARPESDLDHVVLKALEFEPDDRYRSVESLSDDIDRLLAGRPVSARAGRWSYRLRKFVRRNVAAVAASALASLLLAAWVVTVVVQADRVRRERDTAEAVTEFLVASYERVDPTRSRGDRVSAREVLDDSARRIENELGGQPEVKARLLASLGEVYLSLGLVDQAEPLIAGAVALRREASDDPARLAAALLLESTVLQTRGGYDEALERIAEARELHGGGRDGFYARMLRQEAELRFVMGDRAEGLALERAALGLERNLFGTGHLRVLEAEARLATKLRAQREDEEADALERGVFAALPALDLGAHPFVAEMTSRVGESARREDRYDDAAQRLEAALEMQRRLYGPEHASIASNLNRLAWVRWDQGRPDEAAELFGGVLEMEERLFGPDNPRIAPRAYNLGLLLHREFDRTLEAEALFRRALDVREAALGEKSWSTPNTALFQIAHGEALFSLGRYDEAQATVDSILPVWRAYEVYDRRNGCQTRSLLAALQMRRGELAEAVEHLEFCHPVLIEHLDPSHKSVLLAGERLAAALEAVGRAE